MKRNILFIPILFAMMTSVACGPQKEVASNPFFEEWTTPHGVPPFDRIQPEHYAPAFERAMSIHAAEIDALVANTEEPTFENTILAYDRSGLELDRVGSVFGMLCASDLTPEMQALQEEVMPDLSAHSDRIMLNDKLFERIRSVYERRASLGLDAEQLRLVETIYNDFVRSGALLDAARKERLAQINSELATLSVKYGSNLLAEQSTFAMELDKAQVEGMPSSAVDAARERAEVKGLSGKYLFTLASPSRLAMLTYNPNRALREQMYKGYTQQGNHDDERDNKALINDFARLRVEKSNMLGYSSYAAYVTADEMAGTPEAVYALLNEIWTPALERAKEEVEAMNVLLQEDEPGATFEAWDWWYYAEKLRARDYALDEEQLRPYFSLENVQEGIFFLANRLYGITFRPVAVPLYHPEAVAYEVIDTDDSSLGVIYFDYFPREGKSSGAWCGTYRTQRYDNGERVAPVVGVVCNFTPATRSMPSLLTIDETLTLFHEFGHALHNILADVKYRSLYSVEGDFVELPSQVLENWALIPEMLEQYAFHYRTHKEIPASLVRKLRVASHFNQGFTTTELVAAALIDMDIHSITEYKPFDVNEFEANAMNERRGLIPQIAPRYRYPYFSHIFDGGYSAGYYFYLWAEVLDKDAFQAFVESGDPFNREIAARLRTLLASGGSKDGMTLYRNFRGADPDKRAMLLGRGLIEEQPEEVAEETAEAATETNE